MTPLAGNRQTWPPQSHEAGVEKFYSSGINVAREYNSGYLSFGLWTKPKMTYLEAAENLVERLGQTLALTSASQLLDVGSGLGPQDIYLIRRFGPASIDAIDLTWAHVARARERQAKEQIAANRLRYHHGSGTALPFKNESFTHVLSIEAPEHMDAREDFFREAGRVLKPGGILACSDYSQANPPRGLLNRLLFYATRKLWHVPQVNVYNNQVYRQKLAAAGFTNITIENIGGLVFPGYYAAQRRPKSKAAIRKIPGFWKGVVGSFLIDWGVHKVYQRKLCEYIIVRAQKAA